MKNSHRYSNFRLVLHVLAPSSAGAVACLVFGALIVAAHIAMLSLSYGTILPSIFDGDFAAGYTNHIVQPLETLFHNAGFGHAAATVIWGAIGLVFYLFVAGVGSLFGHWREVEDDVPGYGNRRHPLRRSFFLGLLWRVALGAIGVSLLIAGQGVFKRLFAADNRLFVGAFNVRDVYGILVAALVWAAILHIATVFLRLYLLRTRLLGEIIE